MTFRVQLFNGLGSERKTLTRLEMKAPLPLSRRTRIYFFFRHAVTAHRSALPYYLSDFHIRSIKRNDARHTRADPRARVPPEGRVPGRRFCRGDGLRRGPRTRGSLLALHSSRCLKKISHLHLESLQVWSRCRCKILPSPMKCKVCHGVYPRFSLLASLSHVVFVFNRLFVRALRAAVFSDALVLHTARALSRQSRNIPPCPL